MNGLSLPFEISESFTLYKLYPHIIGRKGRPRTDEYYYEVASRDEWELYAPTLDDVSYILIFNHDFARALFGEREFYPDGELTLGALRNAGFEYHLQQAVVSKDPMGYMYGAVFGQLNPPLENQLQT